MFRPPINDGIYMEPQLKASEPGVPAHTPGTRALLFEMPFPLRFGIGHPGRPKLRRYILVSAALPTKT